MGIYPSICLALAAEILKLTYQRHGQRPFLPVHTRAATLACLSCCIGSRTLANCSTGTSTSWWWSTWRRACWREMETRDPSWVCSVSWSSTMSCRTTVERWNVERSTAEEWTPPGHCCSWDVRQASSRRLVVHPGIVTGASRGRVATRLNYYYYFYYFKCQDYGDTITKKVAGAPYTN